MFGDKGYQVAKNELKVNLLGSGCIDMLSSKNLTWDIRKQALWYVMFLKRKRSGKMKGRGCANGRPQQEYITKFESRSPTVLLYALMDSCLMEAMDGRKVITIDTPGVFQQGDWPQDEHPGYIMFKGIMVDIICEIDPSYHDKAIQSKEGKRSFYTVN